MGGVETVPTDDDRAMVEALLGRPPLGGFEVVVRDAAGTPVVIRNHPLIRDRLDPDELTAAHARYAAGRDAALPPDHEGPRPTGGVGGTRQGVKCLHAHYAWFLAGGDDPVGRWVDDRLCEGEAGQDG